MFSVYREELIVGSVYTELHEYVYRKINEKYEIFLIDIILEYVYNMMFEDVINELKYTSILYESPSFLYTGEVIYDIIWCVKEGSQSHCALYQTHSNPLLDNYNSLSYVYDDNLFEKTYEQRKKYKCIYKAHFLIYL